MDAAKKPLFFMRNAKKGMYPNEVTFLAILSACSHTGLVEEGLRIFTSMQEDYNIEAKAEHYTCMVDLLGRAGQLEDAKEFVEKMPIEPEVSTWGALLGACRVHKDMDMGRLAAQRLLN
ncbi:Pentatricopeptide repeat-containing protein [Vitis vinifera]|uniref:Pentatricopeptide repeat-containing protein n=1 Tax=Vitis vinifera TaxID=29760 RepID=A0A438DK59_VITVI|nr:Pentatricopeptide repeat-containing protein [Vitis vinifera]